MTKTLRTHRFGIDGLSVDDLPRPEPGPADVLVSVRAASLNFLDLLVVNGSFNATLPLPHVPGTDVAGIVEAVGKDVTDLRVGDAVIPTFIRPWRSGTPTARQLAYADRPSLGLPGVFAEHVVVPAREVVRKPASMSFEVAATLPIAGLTAWNALRYATLEPGQSILLYGTGGVSLFALSIARAMGVRPIVVGGDPSKLARARELGAAATYDYRAQPDWPDALLEATRGEGVDAVFDVVGGANLNRSIRVVKRRGRIPFVGILTGGEVTLNAAAMLHQQAHLIGMEVGSQDDLVALVEAMQYTAIAPVIDSVVPLAKAADAFRKLEAQQHFGKIVLSFEQS